MSKKASNSPIQKAYGVKKNDLGWVTVEFEIQDGKVISAKESQPDFKAICLENFRRLIAKIWMD